nr:putative tetratricopeptide repeat (TPR)-like superfamily protein [Ipomoea batatas]
MIRIGDKLCRGRRLGSAFALLRPPAVAAPPPRRVFSDKSDLDRSFNDDASSVIVNVCLRLLETIKIELGSAGFWGFGRSFERALKGLVELVRGDIKSAASFFPEVRDGDCSSLMYWINLLAIAALSLWRIPSPNFDKAEKMLTEALVKAGENFLGLYRRAIELLKAPPLETEVVWDRGYKRCIRNEIFELCDLCLQVLKEKACRRDIIALARGGYAETLCLQQNRKAEGERIKLWAESAWKNPRLSLAEALEPPSESSSKSGCYRYQNMQDFHSSCDVYYAFCFFKKVLKPLVRADDGDNRTPAANISVLAKIRATQDLAGTLHHGFAVFCVPIYWAILNATVQIVHTTNSDRDFHLFTAGDPDYRSHWEGEEAEKYIHKLLFCFCSNYSIRLLIYQQLQGKSRFLLLSRHVYVMNNLISANSIHKTRSDEYQKVWKGDI